MCAAGVGVYGGRGVGSEMGVSVAHLIFGCFAAVSWAETATSSFPHPWDKTILRRGLWRSGRLIYPPPNKAM